MLIFKLEKAIMEKKEVCDEEFDINSDWDLDEDKSNTLDVFNYLGLFR